MSRKKSGVSQAGDAVRRTPDVELRPADYAADYLRRSPQTLANWRWRGEGPRYYKVNGSVLYDMNDVRDWLEGQRVEPGANEQRQVTASGPAQ